MKKILAIAVATAIAAPAMADMTIGGSVAAGWSGTDTSGEGFGIDTAAISVSGSETLENGLTVSGAFGFENGQEDATVAGTGTVMSVAGDFGKVAFNNNTFGAYTESYGDADNFVGEFGTESNSDVIAYYAPAMGPVTLVLDTSDGEGIGAGAGNYDAQITALIKAGDFSGRVAYKNYTDADNRVRVGGTYDLGALKIAAAFQSQDDAYDYTSAGVVVPFGATTLSASVAKKEVAATSTDVKYNLNGTSFAVSHALSSNVSVSVKYNDYQVAGATTASAKTDEKATTALISLSF
jgi:hypothetical protein